jgi:hypothetical protein
MAAHARSTASSQGRCGGRASAAGALAVTSSAPSKTAWGHRGTIAFIDHLLGDERPGNHPACGILARRGPPVQPLLGDSAFPGQAERLQGAPGGWRARRRPGQDFLFDGEPGRM